MVQIVIKKWFFSPKIQKKKRNPIKIYNYLCNKLNKSPLCKYSVIIHKFGGLETIPISKTMFGCRRVANILISLFNSSNRSCVMLGLKIFFIATSRPLHLPLWTVLNPPVRYLLWYQTPPSLRNYLRKWYPLFLIHQTAFLWQSQCCWKSPECFLYFFITEVAIFQVIRLNR